MTNSPSHESSLTNFINSLPENTKRALLASAACRQYRAGEIIYAQGASADAMFFVLAGIVNLDCADLTRSVLTVGESFGESEIVRDVRYVATAVAVTDTQLWVLEKSALDILFEKHSALSLALSRHIAHKFHVAQTRPMPLRIPSPRHRGANAKIVFGALTMFFLVAIVFSLALGVFTATTLRVEGIMLTSATMELEESIAPISPTKVAQWVGSSELTRTPIVPTATPTRIPTVKPVATKTPRSQPTPTSAVVAPATPAMIAVMVAPTLLPREWKMPGWTSVEEANVSLGQKYFRLVKAIYFDEASAGGRVNILVGVLDENGKELTDMPVRMAWGGGEYTTRQTEEKRDPFLIPYNLNVIAAHDMASGSSFAPDRGERGGYKIMIEGFPSDVVSGMGLPLRRHVAFLLVFQRTTR